MSQEKLDFSAVSRRMPETAEYIAEASSAFEGYGDEESVSGWSHAKDGLIDFAAGTAGKSCCCL